MGGGGQAVWGAGSIWGTGHIWGPVWGAGCMGARMGPARWVCKGVGLWEGGSGRVGLWEGGSVGGWVTRSTQYRTFDGTLYNICKYIIYI